MPSTRLIPVRFIIMIGHLVILILLLWDRDDSVRACIPWDSMGFSTTQYNTKNIETDSLCIALSSQLRIIFDNIEEYVIDVCPQLHIHFLLILQSCSQLLSQTNDKWLQTNQIMLKQIPNSEAKDETTSPSLRRFLPSSNRLLSSSADSSSLASRRAMFSSFSSFNCRSISELYSISMSSLEDMSRVDTLFFFVFTDNISKFVHFKPQAIDFNTLVIDLILEFCFDDPIQVLFTFLRFLPLMSGHHILITSVFFSTPLFVLNLNISELFL
ncbi:unnamed protein product [Oppiella nova]|uniref:Uncharacterized protein n=1 Tax=Oppiella nova TaxID=334625 RepID=A0A7R9QCX8_9ACAR|nr:unnamed protein product [Oppiella nova]CAG2163290.1 unnamed protein product [Oppiella nova]